MKIELEVNPEDLTKSLKDILDTLPAEKRVEIAKAAMTNWLKEPYDIEKKAKEEEVLSRLRREVNSYSGRTESDSEIRGGWKFREAMQGWKSSKEEMISNITNQIIADYKAEVREVVKADPKIQAMKDEVVQIVKETFPRIFHDAMVAWTASSIQTVLESSMGVKALAESQESLQKSLAERVMGIEGRLASRAM